jgi:hypothetical protein
MPSAIRLTGVLASWHISAHGGYGFADVGRERFFFPRRYIISGDPIPGSTCTFTPAPRANLEVKFPQALNVVITRSKTPGEKRP